MIDDHLLEKSGLILKELKENIFIYFFDWKTSLPLFEDSRFPFFFLHLVSPIIRIYSSLDLSDGII